jgi:hypothetical protein
MLAASGLRLSRRENRKAGAGLPRFRLQGRLPGTQPMNSNRVLPQLNLKARRGMDRYNSSSSCESVSVLGIPPQPFIRIWNHRFAVNVYCNRRQPA